MKAFAVLVMLAGLAYATLAIALRDGHAPGRGRVILYARYAAWQPSAMIEEVWADPVSGIARVRDTYYGADPGVAVVSPQTTFLLRRPGGAEMRAVLLAVPGAPPRVQVLRLPAWHVEATLAQVRAAYARLPRRDGVRSHVCGRDTAAGGVELLVVSRGTLWLPSGAALPAPVCVERDRRTGLPRRLLGPTGPLVVFTALEEMPAAGLPRGFLVPPAPPRSDLLSAALSWVRALLHRR
jgi:hypothetical protein